MKYGLNLWKFKYIIINKTNIHPKKKELYVWFYL